ncbi:MAG: hypothetical protein AVDCRST_MAG33-1235 [uncultured Thermomicrobiales bacterium]|uniref:Uncharacterized protein n=1 Tax=uncultured Thermomicrobiales bacterium TaxID=1645740 RepID=A0A6J4UNF8_9BACT|nr:MAG: hypothetical protein AVDCRST_MAG33-1235 [uncultured Thermomicrobiales bacterium]
METVNGNHPGTLAAEDSTERLVAPSVARMPGWTVRPWPHEGEDALAARHRRERKAELP